MFSSTGSLFGKKTLHMGPNLRRKSLNMCPNLRKISLEVGPYSRKSQKTVILAVFGGQKTLRSWSQFVKIANKNSKISRLGQGFGAPAAHSRHKINRVPTPGHIATLWCTISTQLWYLTHPSYQYNGLVYHTYPRPQYSIVIKGDNPSIHLITAI
jgi:hypothetical protein